MTTKLKRNKEMILYLVEELQIRENGCHVIGDADRRTGRRLNNEMQTGGTKGYKGRTHCNRYSVRRNNAYIQNEKSSHCNKNRKTHRS